MFPLTLGPIRMCLGGFYQKILAITMNNPGLEAHNTEVPSVYHL